MDDPGLRGGRDHSAGPGREAHADRRRAGDLAVRSRDGEGLWGSSTKSWKGILRDHGQGLDRIGAEHYRVLRLPPVTRRGDARPLQRPYTLPQYAPKPAAVEPR